MLLELVILLAILLYLNFEWSNHDIFHPSFVFNAVFLVFALVCLLFQQTYAIQFYDMTVIVISTGVLVFTLATLISRYYEKVKFVPERNDKVIERLKPIEINKYILWILIIIQLLSIYFFIQYQRQISIAYSGNPGNLTANISLYDTMTKFWTDRFSRLNVSVPIFYRLANPITDASSWIILYIAVHNFVATKKINIYMVISTFLQCVLIFLNGSRSPLFRVLTFAIMVYLVLLRKQNGNRLSKKFYIYLVITVFLSAIIFIGMLSFMRKVSIDNLQNYFFTYVGAQLENLNNALFRGFDNIGANLFGAQTFRNLYLYIGKLFGIGEFTFASIDVFTFSNTGVEIGNVYTTFYAFMYDFGIWGSIILTAIMALYFVGTYDKIKRSKSTKFDFRLLIYAYLFNDLIMSAFSNRFYSTVFDAPFLKMIVVAYPLYLIFVKYGFHIEIHQEKDTFLKLKIRTKE